jgi:surfactin synthase thioesterase subunit
MPTSTMVEMLTPIWQRVLQLSSVGLDDNFFDVGGDSALALELFNAIALACGRELPPVMIYQGPTIATLATLLEQTTTPRVPPLVQLKTGSEEPPIFITHGLGGSVMDFFQIVKHIQTPHAIHGMQARGIDGVDEPFDRVEDMARYSLDAVKRLQPHGPYLFIGYSFGGLVTLEMARQLTANGEKIALMAMLDSYPHARYLSPGQGALLATRQAWRRISGKMKVPSGVSSAYQSTADVSSSPALQRFRDSAYLALEHYQPRFYPGKISFVRAAIPTAFPANPAAVWANLAHEFELETVPGDHLGIMTTHFESLAYAISRYVQEALR